MGHHGRHAGRMCSCRLPWRHHSGGRDGWGFWSRRETSPGPGGRHRSARGGIRRAGFGSPIATAGAPWNGSIPRPGPAMMDFRRQVLFR
jgi:hypothetical protein